MTCRDTAAPCAGNTLLGAMSPNSSSVEFSPGNMGKSPMIEKIRRSDYLAYKSEVHSARRLIWKATYSSAALTTANPSPLRRMRSKRASPWGSQILNSTSATYSASAIRLLRFSGMRLSLRNRLSTAWLCITRRGWRIGQERGRASIGADLVSLHVGALQTAGSFGTCPHSQVWGVSGRCPTPEPTKHLEFNANHFGAEVASDWLAILGNRLKTGKSVRRSSARM